MKTLVILNENHLFKVQKITLLVVKYSNILSKFLQTTNRKLNLITNRLKKLWRQIFVFSSKSINDWSPSEYFFNGDHVFSISSIFYFYYIPNVCRYLYWTKRFGVFVYEHKDSIEMLILNAMNKSTLSPCLAYLKFYFYTRFNKLMIWSQRYIATKTQLAGIV